MVTESCNFLGSSWIELGADLVVESNSEQTEILAQIYSGSKGFSPQKYGHGIM